MLKTILLFIEEHKLYTLKEKTNHIVFSNFAKRKNMAKIHMFIYAMIIFLSLSLVAAEHFRKIFFILFKIPYLRLSNIIVFSLF